jgi:hypothetical protein
MGTRDVAPMDSETAARIRDTHFVEFTLVTETGGREETTPTRIASYPSACSASSTALALSNASTGVLSWKIKDSKRSHDISVSASRK